jgi:outer membrane cobalamin receptor
MRGSSIGATLRDPRSIDALTLLLVSVAFLALGAPAPPAQAQQEPAAVPDEAQQTTDDQAKREALPTFKEQIVVTAGRTDQKLGDLPVHVTVVTAEDIHRSSAQTVADLLMQVPAFATHRTSSSRVATPATTPAALRSLGGGFSSRTLVLVDGVPLNDPFFGYVPWERISRHSIERIEVVPTGGAGAWGNQTLGGVINVITRRPEKTGVELDAQFGSLNTVELDLSGSYVRGPVSFSPRATWFDTDGYVTLGEEYRGPADTKSASDNYLLDGRFEYNPGSASRWVLEGSYLNDDRASGTPLSLDHTELLSVSGSGDVSAVAGGSLRLSAFGMWRSGWSTRGSVNASRTAVTPSRDLFEMPSNALGGGVGWIRPLSLRHSVSVGADTQWADGSIHENSRYVATRYTRTNLTGGKQLLFGVYGQDTSLLGSRWRAVAGARLDFWRSSDGMQLVEDASTGAILDDKSFPSRELWTLNPNLGLLYRATQKLGLRASVYRAFRAPTANELYRPLLTGSRNFTQPNENLAPERIARGLESGFDYAPTRSLSLRATGFWNEVDDLITDVTLGTAGRTAEEIPPCGLVPAGGSCRQKQNLERVRNLGTELELRVAPHRTLNVAAAYAYGDSTVTRAPNAPQLVGKRLRRTPKHQATLRVEYANRRVVTASLMGRYNGDRFQDDQNTFHINDSFVVDLSLSRRVAGRLELYLIAENLLDTAFEIDNTADGIDYGHPRWLHVGVRYGWQDGGAKGGGR